jgi:hypothetical protein
MAFRDKSMSFMYKYTSRVFRETMKVVVVERQIYGERIEPLLERKRLKKRIDREKRGRERESARMTLEKNKNKEKKPNEEKKKKKKTKKKNLYRIIPFSRVLNIRSTRKLFL